MTRRRRFSEFWGGAWLATIPGTWGTFGQVNWQHITLPSDGHVIEVVLFLITGTLFIASLFNFREPTSEELFKELFPETAKKGSLGTRIGTILFDAARTFRMLR